MVKLILDPGLFEIENKDTEHIHFLRETIKFASDFFDAYLDIYNGAPFHHFYDPPETYYDLPVITGRTLRAEYAKVKKDILKLICRGEDVTLPSEQVDDCTMSFTPLTITEAPFRQYLFHVFFANGAVPPSDSVLLLLSEENYTHAPLIRIRFNGESAQILAVSDPATDYHQVVPRYLKQSDNPNSMFPQNQACARLNAEFQMVVTRKKMNDNEKKAYYNKFGAEAATRNGYLQCPELAKKNGGRRVFIHARGTYYLSIDTEHGGLELFKNQGKEPAHLGEYNFSCVLQKEAAPQTHKISV